MCASMEAGRKGLQRIQTIVAVLAMCAVCLCFFVAAASAQTTDAASAKGSSSLSEEARQAATVSPAVHHDLSDPLTLMRPAERTRAQASSRLGLHSRNLSGQDVSGSRSATNAAMAQNPLLIGFAALAQLNFDGVGNGFTGPAGTFTVTSAPPSANGDVGPHHYVQVVNDDFAVFDKSGSVLFGPAAVNTLWSGFGGGCETSTDGDATVLYDSISDRWIISQSSGLSIPSLQCVAISQTPDPTGAYYRYSFAYVGASNFYPLLGVWPDAYYATFAMVDLSGNTTPGPKVCAYDRASMLVGAAATQQCFDVLNSYTVLVPADLDGTLPPPAGAPNPIVALGLFDGTGNGSTLATWKFHVDWLNSANSTLSGPTTLSIDPYQLTCPTSALVCIPQLNGSQLLSLGDRLMYRLAYRNFVDGHQSLVVNHSVVVGASSGVRWYELRLDSLGNPSLFQQGTYAPDADWRWMGSAAMDQMGNIAVGYSTSSSSSTPSIRYTGRLATDPAGQMTQGETTVIAGGGSQTGALNTDWGAFSMMAIDPADDCTFWYTNQYIPADGSLNWKTRIASFKFPGCGSGTTTDDFSIAASPTSISAVQGLSASTTIATAVTAGNPQSVALSVLGLPAGATASFGPASITAGGSSTLTISTAASTPVGNYALSVIGTGASAVHATQVTLVVTPAVLSDFSITATPSVISVSQGSVASSPISTAIITAPAETIALSVSGAPAGSTISIAPGSITTGGVATISVNPGTAALGSYAITVTGTSPSTTHSVVVTLKIVARLRDFSISIAPATANLPAGGTVSYTISSSATSAAVQLVALTVAGLPPGVTGSFNPSSIQAGNSSVLTLTATAAAAPGTATFIVTGTNSFGTHSVTAQVTVPAPPPPDFTIAIAPASASVVPGGTVPYTVSTAVINGSTQAITLTVSGLPSGVTGAFNNTTITAGGSAVLTISAGAGVASGFTTFTVTGTTSTTAHSAVAQLVVTTSSGDLGLINGGFETGDFTGWTRTGTTAVVSPGHGGNFAAMLGAAAATNGDSTISQTFIVPAGAGTLSFWYKMTCPDTLTYDWASAFLKDNTTGFLRTVLAKTCATTAWRQVFVNVADLVGHSVTLTLTSHDDDFASDPSFTLFDDVILSPAVVPGGSLVNGGFESGSLTGWTPVGTVSIVTQRHSGSFAARLGSTTATNGDSSISQTFVAPAGATSLSFWYRLTCPDTITYDWATATLRNNTTGTLSTMLPKTCSAVTAWRQVTAAVVPGQSYTLTLTSHDDNYASDPTFTLYDDVAFN